MSDELDSVDKMKDLTAIGEPLGLTFPPGTSKANAREQIREARAKADADTPPADDPAPDDTGNPPSTEPVPPAEEPEDAEPGERRAIERTSAATGAWWCPFCDHSMESKVTACPKCGAARDGDDAVLPEAG